MGMNTVPWDVWADAIAAGVRAVPDEELQRAACVLAAAKIVLVAGNGGSHALASHAAQALMKPGYAAGHGLAAVCLSDGVPTLTAHANDGGWESALEEMAAPFLSRCDCALLLISSSGRSENIVRVAKAAAKQRRGIVTMTGFDGDPLRLLATVPLHVDSRDYEVIEPCHDAILHRIQHHLRQLRGQ